MCAWILSTHDLRRYILGEVHMYKFWWFLGEESTHLTSRYSNLVAVYTHVMTLQCVIHSLKQMMPVFIR